MKEMLWSEIQRYKETFWEISDYIYNNFELRNQEYKGYEKLTRYLAENGFSVEIDVAMRSIGVDEVKEPRTSFGSVDMGNVSHSVTAIHPYLGIGVTGFAAHSIYMAKATVTD